MSDLARDSLAELFFQLPPVLQELTLRRSASSTEGEFVLYWMRTAVRSEENPALDVACVMARQLGLPVCVYHGLSERYPYASDRHHTFILQGAQEVAQGLKRRGVGYLLGVQRRGHRGPWLMDLAKRARLVVTEEFPTDPLRTWTSSLAGREAVSLWTVDTSCVVPMQLVSHAHTRAFEFREATAELRHERVALSWHDQPSPGLFVPEVPFVPVDPDDLDIPALVAECDIDHGVAPVAHTMGGQWRALKRWCTFLHEGVGSYHRRRNDPLQPSAVSRLSAYLHYGHIAATRVAREALAVGGPGAEKFLDELLIWRELAYVYCFRRPGHADPQTLPRWALTSLKTSLAEPGKATMGWEPLSRGATQDRLWDLAQRSLLVNGELHNNVRMTWGKAIVAWSRDPQDALKQLVDLNHRFALDGRDPCSYGGLLWCMGQFDRPFKPSRGPLGLVRGRPTAQHAARLDLDCYERITRRPLEKSGPRVAIIGAGLCGLMAARTLSDHGVRVEVFDRGRRPGGRSCSRLADGQVYDFGLPYLSCTEPRLTPLFESWRGDGLLRPWRPQVMIHHGSGRALEQLGEAPNLWTVADGGDRLAHHLASDLSVHTSTSVVSAVPRGQLWRLTTADGRELGEFDWLLLACPPPQVRRVLESAGPQPSLEPLMEALNAVHMEPCHVLMVERRGDIAPLDVPWGLCLTRDGGPLFRVIAEHSKGRPGGAQRWTAYTRRRWSAGRVDAPRETLLTPLIEALSKVLGDADFASSLTHASTHRWRFGLCEREAPGPGSLVSDSLRVACAGDWSHGGDASAALWAGRSLAGHVLRRAVADSPSETLASAKEPPRQGALW